MANYNAKMMSMVGQGASMFSIDLLDIVSEKANVRVLSADMSTPAGLDKFKSMKPELFINMGIAEQNMVGVAAGLIDEGFRPICVAQSCFLSMRCFEQIRQYAGFMKLPIVFVGIGSGYSLSLMGNTHYALEDIALMRTIPGMQVVAPADSYEAVKAFRQALDSNHPTYIRLFGGTNTPIVHTEEVEFEIGKSIHLRKGSEIQLIATGSMVNVAVKVADSLNEEGFDVDVVDMHTIKPLDCSLINLNAKIIVSIEEHSVIGGLGGALSEYISEYPKHPPLVRIGSKDCFSRVGDYQWLLEENGLCVRNIVNRVKQHLLHKV